MKIFMLSLASLITVQAMATIHTVSNTPSTLAQHNTIQSAVNAAGTGDTVYVHGSPNIYAAFTQTDKQLTIIGPGYAPLKAIPLLAMVQGFTVSGLASNNSEYQGLYITSTVSLSANRPQNLRFIRNHFASISISMSQTSVTYAGYLFESNYFDNSSADATTFSTYQNFVFQNNIFYENGTVRDGNFNGFFNSINVLFDHNLFYGSGSQIRNVTGNSNNRFMTLTNNIFVRRTINTGRITASTFNNNITFDCGINDPWAVSGNTNAGGNVENQDPQMVDQAGVNGGTNNPLLNFTIAAGPANNTGSDAKDMGLLFDATGSLNWNNTRNSRLPRIFQLNVTTPTVAPGGNISLNVDARISN